MRTLESPILESEASDYHLLVSRFRWTKREAEEKSSGADKGRGAEEVRSHQGLARFRGRCGTA